MGPNMKYLYLIVGVNRFVLATTRALFDMVDKNTKQVYK